MVKIYKTWAKSDIILKVEDWQTIVDYHLDGQSTKDYINREQHSM